MIIYRVLVSSRFLYTQTETTYIDIRSPVLYFSTYKDDRNTLDGDAGNSSVSFAPVDLSPWYLIMIQACGTRRHAMARIP